MSSIHPRTSFNNGKKLNTSAPRRRDKGHLAKARENLDRRRAAWSAMKADVQATMRRPGSMRKDAS